MTPSSPIGRQWLLAAGAGMRKLPHGGSPEGGAAWRELRAWPPAGREVRQSLPDVARAQATGVERRRRLTMTSAVPAPRATTPAVPSRTNSPPVNGSALASGDLVSVVPLTSGVAIVVGAT